MDSLLSPPNDQRHKKDVAPLVPGPTAVTARLDGPVHDFDGWFASAAMCAATNRRFGRGKLPGPDR